MVEAFRITERQHRKTAFDGEGAYHYGGRWNSPGRGAVYAAGSRSLAALEILVHLTRTSILKKEFIVFPVRIPEKLISSAPLRLPKQWERQAPDALTRKIGDAFLEKQDYVGLWVPSAVIVGERNLLLNPNHPRFDEIIIGAPESFEFDSRLL